MKNLLKELRENKIHVSIHEGNLKLKFDGDRPSQALISKIKVNKEALISYLQEQEKPKKTHEIIPKVALSEEGYDLSPAQNRLWILSQLEGGLPAYNIPFQVELNSTYDIERFKKSVVAVVERHEILRTVFKENRNGDVKQFVIPFETFDFAIESIDFRNKEEAITDYLNQRANTIFSLREGPLLSASLLRTSDDTYIFHYTMHHIISDGWSMGVLVKDAMAFYESFETINEAEIAPLNIQYKEYAAWQLSKIENGGNEKDKRFWEEQLSGNLPLLNLPSNLNRPSIKTNKGETLETYFSEDLSRKIKEFTQENNSSMFVSLLTMWYVLMYRYTGEKDVIIGAPVAGREHLDLENQIGFYVNTLALRTNVNPEQTVRAYYNTVKEHVFSALSHQTFPFDHLVKGLNLSRDTSRSMVFDVMLAFQNTGEKISDQFVQSTPGNVESKGDSLTKFDIEINFSEVGKYISFVTNYNTDVYEKEMIEQLMRHFMQLVEVCLDMPDVAIKDLEFLTNTERDVILRDFNSIDHSYALDKTIVDFFEHQASSNPNAIAVKYSDKQYSYEELQKLSTQLAKYLLEVYNIRPNDLVGIQLERSENLPLSILSVLKARGAYVPIDIHYPEDRITFIKKDANLKIIIDQQFLDCFFNDEKEYSEEIQLPKPQLSDLTYCIYTSGSTGNPKGVLNNHSGLINRLLWMQEYLNIKEPQVFLQKTPYTFDVSVWEFLLPLISHSKLIMAKPEGHKDPFYLKELIINEQVNIIHFVPSMYNVFLNCINYSSLDSLNHLICSGEELGVNNVKQTRELLPNIKLHNFYGPTEAAIDVTAIDLTHQDITKGITIGRPVPNVRIYIVDDNLQLQPIGVSGELLISGIQVAEGYLNLESLTKEKFITDPFFPKERVYKTGDIAQWNSDGTLKYIGRKDHQVKVRGNRIELGEIENTLLDFEGIQKAVIVVRSVNNENTIVAYYISETKEDLDKKEIKELLYKKLPEYMIPNFFVQLNTISLTSSGKIDRKSLPDISEKDVIKQKYIAPQNEIEEKIISIISEETGNHISIIGVTDNFFDLGLDSFSLLKILNEINLKLGVDLKPLDLFQYPNVKSLTENALCIKQEEDESTINIAEDMDSMVDIF